MNRVRKAGLVLMAAGLLMLAGCGSAESGPADEAAAGTRTVQTMRGPVDIPADPQRVVVLNYALVGYLFNLGIPVAATVREDVDHADGAFSPFWAEQAEAAGTKFLPWTADGYQVEAILGEQPDLIIAGGIGFPLAQAQQAYDQLSAVAPTVLVGGDLQTWEQQLGFLANDVFAKPERYAELQQAYQARIAEVAGTITPPPTPIGVLVMTPDGRPFGLMEKSGLLGVLDQVGLQPGTPAEEHGVEPYTSGGDMFESSPERVGELFDQPTMLVMGFNGDVTSVEKLRDDELYAQLPAFREDRAYDLSYWMLRGDYDETMALLDRLEELFG